MRPRKRVLLYCADYDRRNDLAYVLRVRLDRVVVEAFAAIEELAERTRELAQSPEFGCLVLVAAGPGDRRANGQRRNNNCDDLAQKIDFELLLRDPEVASRTVEVRSDARGSTGFAAQCVAAGDMAALAHAMRVAATRKRGPKKKLLPAVWMAEQESAVA